MDNFATVQRDWQDCLRGAPMARLLLTSGGYQRLVLYLVSGAPGGFRNCLFPGSQPAWGSGSRVSLASEPWSDLSWRRSVISF
ncbi:hypothetical protein LshimejAT787_0202630 [Lyophyllum shimeji]|uniref:Uncharacterized protein n=1 Tax=Lyophyllum shimeji TaxID=47721 RepID=A0A9P3PFX4_LYOSH|nr:hypothetical protein LshimejAT787_0202630 [Lyophyllum shimeji]